MNDDGSVDLYFGPKARLASKITADDGEEAVSLVPTLRPGRGILEQDI